jgi:hypothetical protein
MILEKYSIPGWQKKFDSEHELVTELRKHICRDCLNNRQTFVGEAGIEIEEDGDLVVDTIHEGVRYECRDVGILLSTPCGCEFGVEDEDNEMY